MGRPKHLSIRELAIQHHLKRISSNQIVILLGGKVSERTVFRWKNEFKNNVKLTIAMSKPILGTLICIRFLVIVLLITALVLTCLIPKDTFFNNIETRWQNVRIAGIVIYSVAIIASLVTLILQFLNLCAYPETRFFTIVINIVDFIIVLSVIGISIPMFMAEETFDEIDYAFDVKRSFYIVSGIMGIAAAAFYLLDLLMSRCFQFAVSTNNVEYYQDSCEKLPDYEHYSDPCHDSCHDHCSNHTISDCSHSC
ncbi:unnamed protein product [Brachionus calyciflorus]|uniref:MARVEL domain-containing protein n=1 Tax=Brachionus calyciflorus TaxID=104777 RepID=A0A814DZS1_9BILA|nr:unnamed protein product [Brachionus calyciflorus]